MNLILDFTHTYSREWIEDNPDFTYIDCSDISGTDMYCSSDAEEEIYRRIAGFPQGGIHFIDSGNYHYVTGIFTQKIKKPYNLVFFDNHNDMQPTMIPGLLSCGAWAKRIIETDDNLQRMFLIGATAETIKDIEIGNREQLSCISIEDIDSCRDNKAELINKKLALADMSLPLYISVDKDVLSGEYAHTNWNQGTMSLNVLKQILQHIFMSSRAYKGTIAGIDICGELPGKDASFAECAKAEAVNRRTNSDLIEFINRWRM